ncbi:hypothetical protein [Parvularcula oceani]|uniref:hypothetical protein n=1 Tax=Parvularcula oceani TaxID=1247963 RepID=UPI000AC543E8|nr:hypothetical protein [Parvularcula oceani]
MSIATAPEPAQDQDLDLDLDLDFDLDDLDEAELQRLLEEDEDLLEAEPTEEPVSEAAPGPAVGEAPEAVPAPPPLVAEDPEEAEAAPAPAPAEAPPAAEPAREAGEEDLDAATLATLSLSPVPRINIHAFCRDAALSALIERAAADRRLAKAHVTIQNGDAFRAAQVFAYEPTPNLILLEAGQSPQELLQGLEALAEVCDPSTRVVVIGAINDIQLYRALMERGISDYLVAPRSPLQIISAVSSLYADPSAPPVGKSYVFMGARGGTGSSTICHNVAWAMAEQCLSDTVMMDMDLAFGTGSLDFEQDPSQGLSEALGAPERLDDVLLDRLLQKCTDRLSLFAAPNLLDRDYDLPAESFESVVDMVRSSAPSVAIDMPHIWTAWSRQQIQSAEEIVITATPDLAAFRNAKNIFETVAAERGNDSAPILVLNQTGVKGRPEIAPEQFEDALGVAPLVTLPFDPVTFGTASTNAQTVFEVAPKSKLAAGLSLLARHLLGQDMAAAKPGLSLKSLFAKRG